MDSSVTDLASALGIYYDRRGDRVRGLTPTFQEPQIPGQKDDDKPAGPSLLSVQFTDPLG